MTRASSRSTRRRPTTPSASRCATACTSPTARCWATSGTRSATTTGTVWCATRGWLQPFRELFGDERADYTAALKANYENGPPADWALRHISSYASTHPWEDWAETWAHYLHVVDSLETALGYGIDTYNLETEVEPFSREDLYAPDDPGAPQALAMINSWLELTTVVNELVRSMGQPDFYPFVMSKPVVRKLHFVHLVARSAGQA